MKDGVNELYRLEKSIYTVTEYENYREIKKDKTIDERISFDDFFKGPTIDNGFAKIKSKITTEDEFNKNVKNLLTSIRHEKNIIVVEKSGDKISIKLFYVNKFREVGKKYFKDNRNLDFVTYNTKTNDLYSGHITEYHKRKKSKKVLRRNQFWRQPLESLRSICRLRLRQREGEDAGVIHIYPISEFNRIFDIFLNNIPNLEGDFLWTHDEILFKTRCNNIGIKLPNNWSVFSKKYPTLTKKELKKHGYKYIETLQSHYGLTGGKFKKLFHELTEFNNSFLEFAINYFGIDFIRNQSNERIIKIMNSSDSNYTDFIYDKLKIINFTKKEKNNLWYLMTSGISHPLINEHLYFINRLREVHNENVELKAKNNDQFIIEHNDYSLLLESYNKGISYRFYNDEFVKRVEVPIFDKEYYYPVLLTSTDEYNEESNNQSNCVRGYVDKVTSIIVSLRKGDIKSKERATIEYRITKSSNRFTLMNIQCLGRFNATLNDEWNKVIKQLNLRMDILGSSNVFTLPEMITKFKNEEIYRKAVFSLKGEIKWDKETKKHISIPQLI
jgi:hypothetical protein